MGQMTKFVLAGFGNVGRQIAGAVLADPGGDLEIAAISARHLAAARQHARTLGLNVPVIPAAQAPEHGDIIVECATYEAFRDIVEPAVRAGCHVIAVSIGALAANMDLIDLAEKSGATIQIASGALPGLDALRAARQGHISSVKLVSHILPASLAREPYISEHNIDLAAAKTSPVQVFSGTARLAAGHFPRHFNVAVALSLAGIGLDRTLVEIYANARLPGVRHTVSVEADAVHLEMTSQNVPSPENHRTSAIVAPSILAALRELNATLRVGS
ncbi:MAG: aspartate dehydrogenase domain-containing protein [Hyphomicrobiales bacterium]